MPARAYALRYTQRGVLWLACAMALGGFFLPSWPARIASGALGLAVLAALWWQRRTRPVLTVDDDGLRVTVGGRPRVELRWAEVLAVRADAAEKALYVDAGTAARSILIPPARGYGYVWEQREQLYDDIVAHAGERLKLVERL